MILKYLVIWISLEFINCSLTGANGEGYISSLEKKKDERVFTLIEILRLQNSKNTLKVTSKSDFDKKTHTRSTGKNDRSVVTNLNGFVTNLNDRNARLKENIYNVDRHDKRFNPSALRMAKILWNFGHSEGTRVKRRVSNELDNGSVNITANSKRTNHIEDVDYRTLNAKETEDIVLRTDPTVENSGTQPDTSTNVTVGTIEQSTSVTINSGKGVDDGPALEHGVSVMTFVTLSVTTESVPNVTTQTEAITLPQEPTMADSKPVTESNSIERSTTEVNNPSTNHSDTGIGISSIALISTQQTDSSSTASFIITQPFSNALKETPRSSSDSETVLQTTQAVADTSAVYSSNSSTNSPSQPPMNISQQVNTVTPSNTENPDSGVTTTVQPEESVNTTTSTLLVDNTSDNNSVTYSQMTNASAQLEKETETTTSSEVVLVNTTTTPGAVTREKLPITTELEPSTKTRLINVTTTLRPVTRVETLTPGLENFPETRISNTTIALEAVTRVETITPDLELSSETILANTTTTPRPVTKVQPITPELDTSSESKLVNTTITPGLVTRIGPIISELEPSSETKLINTTITPGPVTRVEPIIPELEASNESKLVNTTSTPGPVTGVEPITPELETSSESKLVNTTSTPGPVTKVEPLKPELKPSSESQLVNTTTTPGPVSKVEPTTPKLETSSDSKLVNITATPGPGTKVEPLTRELELSSDSQLVNTTITSRPGTKVEHLTSELNPSTESKLANTTTTPGPGTKVEHLTPEIEPSSDSQLVNTTSTPELVTNVEPTTPELEPSSESSLVNTTQSLGPVTRVEPITSELETSSESSLINTTQSLEPVTREEPITSELETSSESSLINTTQSLGPVTRVEPITSELETSSESSLINTTQSPGSVTNEELSLTPEHEPSSEIGLVNTTTTLAPVTLVGPLTTELKARFVNVTTPPGAVTRVGLPITPGLESSSEISLVNTNTTPGSVTRVGLPITLELEPSTHSRAVNVTTLLNQMTSTAPPTQQPKSFTETSSLGIITNATPTASPASNSSGSGPMIISLPATPNPKGKSVKTSLEPTTNLSPTTTFEHHPSFEPKAKEEVTEAVKHTSHKSLESTADPTPEPHPHIEEPKGTETNKHDPLGKATVTMETESTATQEVSTVSEPTAEPEVTSDNYPEAESEPETFAEPGPDWELAKIEWKEAWEFHVYFFGAMFTLLGLYCIVSVIRLWSMEHLLSRHYFLTLNSLVIFVCVFRAIYLLVDAYNSHGTFPVIMSYFMYSIVFPCITAVFSILFYALLLATRLQVLSPKVQKLWVLMIIILFHFGLSLSTDIVVGLFASASLMFFICQLFFVLWGLLMFIGYFIVFKKLYSAALNRQKALKELSKEKKLNGSAISFQEKKPKQRYTLGLAVKVTFLSALFGLACIGFEVYGMFGVYGIMRNKKPHPWPWWSYHVIVRTIELLMCCCVAYVAAQPLKYIDKKRKRNWLLYCLPCKFICCHQKGNDSVDGEFISMDLDRYVVSESDHRHWNKRHIGKTHSSPKAPYPPHTSEKYKDPNATLLLRKFKQSMLVVEDGFVRIKREDEVIPLQYQPDFYSRSSGLNSSCVSVHDNNSAISNAHSSRTSVDVGVGTESVTFSSNPYINTSGVTNEAFSPEDARHRASINLQSCDQTRGSQTSIDIEESVVSDTNSSEDFRPLSMLDLAVSIESELQRAFHSSHVDGLDLISHNSLPLSLERQSSESNEFVNEDVCERYGQVEHDPFSYLESPSYSSDSADNQLQLSSMKLLQTPVRRSKSVDAKTHNAKVKLFEKNKYYSLTDIDTISKDEPDGAFIKELLSD